jgi:hypothetical protein
MIDLYSRRRYRNAIVMSLSLAATAVGLGWLVLGPMVVGSCYAGWRTIFGR